MAGLSMKNNRRIQERLVAVGFVLPAFILFCVFSWWPIIRGFIISFQKYHPTKIPTWCGLDNFKVLFDDPLFFTAWWNVIYFVFLALLIGYFVPIVLAITINEMRHLRSYFRIGYYLPAILPLVVVAIMWKWFYRPQEGLFNYFLNIIHLPVQGWLNDPHLAMFSIVLMATWKGAGATTIIYLASLQSIPEDLYEAAEIDGASLLRRIWHITLPQISPVMLIILILQIIGTFQVFAEPFIMTDGGPNNATLTVMLLIYRYAFKYYDMGVAAAMGLTLFIVLLVFTIIYFRITKKLGLDKTAA